MFGSFIAGLVVGDSKFRLGRGYGLAILIESAALFACLGFLKKGWVAGDCCAAFACGLQNALGEFRGRGMDGWMDISI